jgi:hypothetical protein
MSKAKRMLAGRCYPVIAGARDCVTSETDAWVARTRPVTNTGLGGNAINISGARRR